MKEIFTYSILWIESQILKGDLSKSILEVLGGGVEIRWGRGQFKKKSYCFQILYYMGTSSFAIFPPETKKISQKSLTFDTRPFPHPIGWQFLPSSASASAEISFIIDSSHPTHLPTHRNPGKYQNLKFELYVHNKH